MTKLGYLLIAAALACQSKEPSPARRGSQAGGPTGSAVSQAAGSATEDTAHQNMTGQREHHAANCPSLLPGTTTRIAMTPRGVDVTVTSLDPTVVRRIVSLAEFHSQPRPGGPPAPHNQRHGGPGWTGYCPVLVTDKTAVTVTPMSGGATIHVNARSPGQVTAVQELIKARAVQLPGYVSS